MENSSVSIRSFSPIDQGLSAGILNLNKKRKCSNDLELPCPKHKCSYHGYPVHELSFKADEGSSSSTNIIKDTCFTTTADESSDQHEVSDKESGSIVVEDYGSLMVLDDDKNEHVSNQYFTALGACDDNAFRNALFSLDSRCIKREKIHEITDFDNSSAGSIETDERHQEFGHYTIKGHEDVMLYSIAADARLGVKKPTIDQEFDQYFSLLML